MKVYDVYSDPGFTGANTNRPELQKMFNDIKEDKINLVMTYKIDRLTRSPKDFYQMIEFFEKYDVSFISVTERFDTSTPSGRLLRNIMLTFSQFERELTGERVRDKLLERAQKGFHHGGYDPLGYKKENKRLIIDEHEAKAVKYIFEEYVEGTPLPEIVQGLIKRKITQRNGKQVDKSRIWHVLRNPIYTGIIRFKGKSYKGIHEAIISNELFQEAQTINPQRTKSVKHYKTCYLKGLIKCAECGSNMTPTHAIKKRNGRKRRYYYYRCTCTYKKDWYACSTRQISANRLEDCITNHLERISLDETYLEHLIEKNENSESSNNHSISGVVPLLSGFEISETTTKLTPDHLGQTLINFLKELKNKQGIEKHLNAKKHIKNVIYSKEKITINLFTTNSSGSKDPRSVRNSDLGNCLSASQIRQAEGDMHTQGERPTKIPDQNPTFLDSFSIKKMPKQQDVALAHTKLSGETGI